MSRRSTSNAKNSDTTSKTRPSPRSEKELLTHQADAAKAALFHTARETAGRIAATLDPSPLIRKHPWQAAGFAAVGGFLAGAREKNTPDSPSLLSILMTTGAEILKNSLIPVVTTELSKRFSKES